MNIISSLKIAHEQAKTLKDSYYQLKIQKALAGLDANYGELIIQGIHEQAIRLGWTEEELTGSGILPSDRSLLQGLNSGDKIVLVEEEVIAVQRISGQIHIRKKKPWQKLSSHVEKKIENLSKSLQEKSSETS